jgi:hypothetical protein
MSGEAQTNIKILLMEGLRFSFLTLLSFINTVIHVVLYYKRPDSIVMLNEDFKIRKIKSSSFIKKNIPEIRKITEM